ncbi:hypothetical protein GV829_08365 [Sphingomonas lacunae]|uniref:Uncharacterized protein n=1 Tax=Sphingomonas lacunae TaxID=2698828 RepID=A0A6M4ATL1_9SPHN|nr:hypothetical protein [Sphingomonas lacunae]QJQ32458.1 hypothetical protein GV829_08365 [Sphingomonas lacunae]
MIATGYGFVTIATISAGLPNQAVAQQAVTLTAPSSETPVDYIANARRFARIRTHEDCRAEAAATSDIVVCGRQQDEGLPLPEIYGPVAGSTDGAAVDPRGEPCGASISGQCYSGVDLPQLLGAAVNVVGLIIDPDRNLGEGTRVPERFRGANR